MNRQKQCKMYQKLIDLRNSETGDSGLVNHGGKRRCLATVRNNELEEERRAAAASLEDLRQNASLSPRTPFRPLRISSSPIYIRSAHPDLICVRKFVVRVGIVLYLCHNSSSSPYQVNQYVSRSIHGLAMVSRSTTRFSVSDS
jgi:hypothetical protein